MSLSLPIQKPEDIKLVTLDSRRRKRSQLDISDARIPLPEGTELMGYRVGKLLGAGSFSLVYGGIDLETGRCVAIKEYFPKRFAERKSNGLISPMAGPKKLRFGEGFKLFYSEAKALEKFKHPNVPHMLRLFRANRTAYLVSNNEGGRDLKWFLTSLKMPLNQEQAYKVFLPIMSALDYLHNRQTMHLDIKPANILLQPNGRSLLLDFGAARAMHSEDSVDKMQVVTHGFAPPEQYEKKRGLGPWSDIYALAATIYFSIVGKMPDKSKGSTMPSSIDIMKYGRAYSSATLEATNRALSYEVSMRFDSIEHFAEAFLEGSEWFSLQDFEIREMGFDRFASVAAGAHNKGALVAA